MRECITIVGLTVIILLCTGSVWSEGCGIAPCPPVIMLRRDGNRVKPSFNTSTLVVADGLNLPSGTITSDGLAEA